jgi:hypothetical protein
MDRLTPEQARAVCEAVRPMGGYLWRLAERMDQTNLRVRDRNPYRLVTAANDVLHALWVELHDRSVG